MSPIGAAKKVGCKVAVGALPAVRSDSGVQRRLDGCKLRLRLSNPVTESIATAKVVSLVFLRMYVARTNNEVLECN